MPLTGSHLPFDANRKGTAGHMKGRSSCECSSFSKGSMCTLPNSRPSSPWMQCQHICLARSAQHLMTCASYTLQVSSSSLMPTSKSCSKHTHAANAADVVSLQCCHCALPTEQAYAYAAYAGSLSLAQCQKMMRIA